MSIKVQGLLDVDFIWKVVYFKWLGFEKANGKYCMCMDCMDLNSAC